MKTIVSILSLAAAVMVMPWAAEAQERGQAPILVPPPAPGPVGVSVAPAPVREVPPPRFVYEQRLMGGRRYLITPEQAQEIVDLFKSAYERLERPRILIYVNRDLVDRETGLKLSARSEQIEVTRGNAEPDLETAPEAEAHAPEPEGNLPAQASDREVVRTGIGSGETRRLTQKNTYRIREAKTPSLADRQTTRDIERLFGRPLRLSGAALVDQRTATALIADRPLGDFVVATEGESARKDREALRRIADVAIEILVASKEITVPGISGDLVYQVPDIQATAIRLSDSRILGQASSTDIIGRESGAGRVARSFDVREITEATALSLMEDMAMTSN